MTRRSATLEQLPLTVGLPALNTLLRMTIGVGPGPAWPARVTDVPSRLEDVVLGRPGRVSLPGSLTGSLTALSSSRARADEIGQADLLVAEPVFAGNLEPPTIGTGCLVTWVSEHGLHELATSYQGTEQVGPVLRGWRLTATGQVRRLQRRRTPRATCRLPVTVDGRLGHTLDVSEGGLRALVSVTAPAIGTVGAAVAVTLMLDSGVISPEAHVVHARELFAADAALSAPPDRTELGVSFDEPWVYAHLLRAFVADRHDPTRRR